MPQPHTFGDSDYHIPVSILHDKTLTVAEHIVKTLKETYNLNYH